VRISKPVHGIMEIAADSNNGVVWINSCDGQCILRIGGLKFERPDERFSSIDIFQGKATMYSDPENEELNMVSNFLNSVLETVVGKIIENPTKEKRKFLVSILDKLKEFIQEER
jgi:hypothetical protein